MARAALVSLRRYKGEDFLVVCNSRNPSTGSYRAFWLDGQGALREGFMGVLDALEGVPIYAEDSRPLWDAVKALLGRLENRRDWKVEISDALSGSGNYPESSDDPDMPW